MMLCLTIIDDCLGCEGVVFVVVVLLCYLSHCEVCVVSGELLLDCLLIKGEYLEFTWEI